MEDWQLRRAAMRAARIRLWGGAANASCHWCGVALTREAATLDHVLPDAFGGKLEDCVLACYDCNQERGCLTAIAKYERRVEGTACVGERRRKLAHRLARMKRRAGYEALKEKWDAVHAAKGFDFWRVVAAYDPARDRPLG